MSVECKPDSSRVGTGLVTEDTSCRYDERETPPGGVRGTERAQSASNLLTCQACRDADAQFRVHNGSSEAFHSWSSSGRRFAFAEELLLPRTRLVWLSYPQMYGVASAARRQRG